MTEINRDEYALEERLRDHYEHRYQDPPAAGMVWARLQPHLDTWEESKPDGAQRAKRWPALVGLLAFRQRAIFPDSHEEKDFMQSDISVDTAEAYDPRLDRKKLPLRRRALRMAEVGIAAVLVASLVFAWLAVMRSRSNLGAMPAPLFSYTGQPGERVSDLKWTPDKRYLTFMMYKPPEAGGGSRYLVWNAATGKLKQTLAINYSIGSGSGGENITDSSDGRYSLIVIYDATKQVGKVILVNIFTGQVKQIYQGNHYSSLPATAFSNENNYVAIAGGDGHIHIWDIARNKMSFTIGPVGISQLPIMGWSSDDRRIIEFSNSSTDTPVLQEWSAQTGQKLANIVGTPSMSLFPFHPPLDNGGFSPDGQRILTFNTQAGTFEERDSSTLKILQTFHIQLMIDGHVSPSGAYSGSFEEPYWQANGTRISLGTGQQQVSIWNAITGQLLQTFSLGTQVPHDGVGRYISLEQKDNQFEILDTLTGAKVANIALTARPANQYWLPDDKHLAFTFGNNQRQGQLYDALTGRLLLNYQSSYGSISLSPDGKYAAIDREDNTLKSVVEVLAVQ